jgi:branched-chain amino acid transport system substrate-binding protein
VSDVNARGGLNGHPVKLLVADDGGDPSKALANVKRMVEVDKVQAFYATRDFLTGQAYMSYLEEKKIPVITTCACNPVDGPSPMTFDPYLVAGGEGGVWMHVGPLLTLSEKRKVALMYCREAPICVVIRNNMKKVEKTLGITIVWEGQNSIAQPDYTAELLSARNSGADSIVSINDNDTNIRILRDKRRLAWDVPYSTQFSNHDDRFLKFAGADAEGILLSGSIANYDVSPKMADFRAAMAKYQPGLGASDFAAGAWSSGKMLEKIASRFGDTVTTQDILEGLYSLNKETLDGRIAATTYPRDKPHDRVNLCIIPLTIKSGKFVPKNGDEFFCEPGWQPA